ncbi:unnamed protein product [Calicophoron daubneyi]|uniref:IQ domain-containing protein K n=1 Tax=Calicophoron daubneyi TaxID=300641 RepID=A0AAV2T6N1_CALDB
MVTMGLWDQIIQESDLIRNGVPEELFTSNVYTAEYVPVFSTNLTDEKNVPSEQVASAGTPTEYLNKEIFPTLLPALEAMLHTAKGLKCFERKRFGFNGLDFLTFYLYKNHPAQGWLRSDIQKMAEIPWVAEEWSVRPRPALPLSLQWTDEEAATKLQAYWRGYLVRRKSEIQELRQWQRDWRKYNESKRKTQETA